VRVEIFCSNTPPARRLQERLLAKGVPPYAFNWREGWDMVPVRFEARAETVGLAHLNASPVR
jgi:hypothetical protein